MCSRRDQEGPQDFVTHLFYSEFEPPPPHPSLLALLVLVESTSMSVVFSTSTLLWPSPHFRTFPNWLPLKAADYSFFSPFLTKCRWSLLSLAWCDGDSFGSWVQSLPPAPVKQLARLGQTITTSHARNSFGMLRNGLPTKIDEVTDLVVSVKSSLPSPPPAPLCWWAV